MGFKKSSIWISGPQIVPYQIRQNVFNLKSTLEQTIIEQKNREFSLNILESIVVI